MTLKITAIADAGVLEKERIVLRAYSDINLTNYAVFCCRAGSEPGKFVAGNVPAVYWFWNNQIKKDDLVVVYTKKGTASTKAIDGNNTTHFYYWQLSEPIWTDDHVAVAVHTAAWVLFDSAPIPSE